MVLNLSGAMLNVGWVRHTLCAVIHRMCRQALTNKCFVLLRNAWWATRKTLAHPTLIGVAAHVALAQPTFDWALHRQRAGAAIDGPLL